MNSQFRTYDELAVEALGLLTGSAADFEPGAEEIEYVKGQIPSLMEILVSEDTGISTWIAGDEQVANELFIPLASLLANVCGPRVAATPRNIEIWERDIQWLRKITGVKVLGRELRVDRPYGLRSSLRW